MCNELYTSTAPQQGTKIYLKISQGFRTFLIGELIERNSHAVVRRREKSPPVSLYNFTEFAGVWREIEISIFRVQSTF